MAMSSILTDNLTLPERRLFLEELCCELCRFLHMVDEGLAPETVFVEREVSLGPPGAFSDIHVGHATIAPYFVEVKYGLPEDELLARLHLKYGVLQPEFSSTRRLVIVVHTKGQDDRAALKQRIASVVSPALEVEHQVVALFGVPDRCPGYVDSALQAAKALRSIGRAVADSWQRQLDREQPSAGMHIGVAYGNMQIVALRPSSRTHSTAIADVINVASRLMSAAAPGEILIANSFYQQLPQATRNLFSRVEPQEAHNVGKLRAWRLPARTT
jgi:hypothetical protein